VKFWGALFVTAFLIPASYLAADDDSAESYYQRGLKLERVRSYDAAASFYDAAVKKDPQFAAAFKELGNCHYYLGDKMQAYRDYQAYLLLRPDDQVIAALAAKIVPPTPTPEPTTVYIPGPAPTPDPESTNAFFHKPGWQENVAADAERAQGKFQVPLGKALKAASEILADCGQDPPLKGFGRVHSGAFQINQGFLLGREENQGDNSVYSLEAAFEDHQAFLQVRWKLYKIYDVFYGAEQPQPGSASGGSMEGETAEPPTQEESRQNDVRVLNEGKQTFAKKGLPKEPIELAPAMDKKMQRDWNWRLWMRLRGGSEKKGGVEVKGWATPVGSTLGYNLYMSEMSGGAYKKMNDKPIKLESYRIENLVVGKKYYFVMSATTTENVESRLSPEWSMTASTDTK
jgi:hypothetical protein